MRNKFINIRRLAKILLSISIVMFVVLSFAAVSNACTLKLYSSESTVEVGQVVEVTLERYKTHSNCILPLSETKITVENGTLVDAGSWVEGSPDILRFKVVFDKEGEGTVIVTRNCPKGGLMQATLKVKVVPKSDGSSLIDQPSSDTSSGSAGVIDRSSNADSGQGEESSGATSSKSTDKVPDSQTTSTASGKTQEENGVSINVSSKADSEEATASQKAQESVNSQQSEVEGNASSSFLRKLLPANVFDWLWLAFILAGILLYLFKAYKLRKPFLFLSVIVLGFYVGGCNCPIGGIFKIFLGTVSLVFLVPTILTLVFGRVFCGWVCPMGGVQELIHAPKLRFKVPQRLDRGLNLLKYFVLVAFIIIVVVTGKNVWGEYEPFKVLFNFTGGLIASILLAAVLFASLFVERFFCRYLCPYGAFLSILSRFSLLRLKVDKEKCVNCGQCTRGKCPMGAISKKDGECPVINSGKCIKCNECESCCNKKAIR